MRLQLCPDEPLNYNNDEDAIAVYVEASLLFAAASCRLSDECGDKRVGQHRDVAGGHLNRRGVHRRREQAFKIRMERAMVRWRQCTRRLALHAAAVIFPPRAASEVGPCVAISGVSASERAKSFRMPILATGSETKLAPAKLRNARRPDRGHSHRGLITIRREHGHAHRLGSLRLQHGPPSTSDRPAEPGPSWFAIARFVDATSSTNNISL